MFAIVEIGGKQEIVAEKMKIQVPVVADGAKQISLDKVLLQFSPDAKTFALGAPFLAGKSVDATVIGEPVKSDKIMGAKFKRRKRYTRIFGSRQISSTVEIGKLA